MKIAHFLIIAPFVSFLAGFCVISLFVQGKSIQTPTLLGHSVTYALRQATQQDFVIKILAEKESSEVQPGTILAQKPLPGASIKPKQTVFIVIAQEPAQLPVPECVGLRDGQWQERIAEYGITAKPVFILHRAPVGMVVAQAPQAGSALRNQKMTLFISAGPETKRIMPNICGHILDDSMKNFFENYGIEIEVYSEPYHLKKHAHLQPGTIIAQKPVAGSWVDIKKPLQVHLVVLE